MRGGKILNQWKINGKILYKLVYNIKLCYRQKCINQIHFNLHYGAAQYMIKYIIKENTLPWAKKTQKSSWIAYSVNNKHYIKTKITTVYKKLQQHIYLFHLFHLFLVKTTPMLWLNSPQKERWIQESPWANQALRLILNKVSLYKDIHRSLFFLILN